MVSHEVQDAPFMHSHQRLKSHVCIVTPACISWGLQPVISRINRVQQYLDLFDSLDRSLRQSPLPRRSYFACLVLLFRSCNLTFTILLALLRFNFVVHSLSKGFLERGNAWDRCDLQGVGSGAFLTGGIYVYPAVYF